MNPTISSPTSVCGPTGYKVFTWAPRHEIDRLAARLAAANHTLTRNPHITEEWAWEAVCAPPLVDQVRAMIGPELAVENTFLITKHPGTDFEVPPHQDGVNDHLLLDPARSVAVWLALTDATTRSGCLEVAAGSHVGGYLPYHRTNDTGAGAPLAAAHTELHFTKIPMAAGDACAMDVRLIHRSGRNHGETVRAGLNIRYAAPGGIALREASTHPLHVVAGGGWRTP